MKKIILLTAILINILFFSQISYAQVAPEPKKYDCAVGKEKMLKDLMENVTCIHDEECGWFDYGYPWQPSECVKAIINTKKENHNITNLRLIEEYNNYCINPNVDEKKKYDDFAKKLAETVCDLPRTYCYKGFCRIQSYAIYNDK